MGRENERTLVVVEREEEGVAGITFELLRVGRDLADKCGGALASVIIGANADRIAEDMAGFSDEVYLVDDPLLGTFRSDLYLHVLEKLCEHLSPEVVLMGHTLNSLELAPRLAYRVGGKLVTDCSSITREADTGVLLCTKPVYGDRANAVFAIGGKPKLATLRSKSVEPVKEGNAKGAIIKMTIDCREADCASELIRTVPGESVSLDKADAIVAGGRGIKDTEGLRVLGGLIDALKKYFDKVEMGASRPLIDAGLLPKSRQLGQTGERAAPDLYIAVAISGSTQHLSGIAGSKRIVAINKDPEAPIFDVADYGIVGAYESVVPALTGKLRAL